VKAPPQSGCYASQRPRRTEQVIRAQQPPEEIAEAAEAAWLATAEGLKGRWADAARPEPSHEDQAPL